jgi:hypothetical protein
LVIIGHSNQYFSRTIKKQGLSFYTLVFYYSTRLNANLRDYGHPPNIFKLLSGGKQPKKEKAWSLACHFGSEEGQGVKMPAQEDQAEARSKPVQLFQTGFHWKSHVALSPAYHTYISKVYS